MPDQAKMDAVIAALEDWQAADERVKQVEKRLAIHHSVSVTAVSVQMENSFGLIVEDSPVLNEFIRDIINGQSDMLIDRVKTRVSLERDAAMVMLLEKVSELKQED